MRAILLVDDSPADQIALRSAAHDVDLDCQLVIVENGLEALACLRGEGIFGQRDKFPFPDLILLDINLPLMDGRETLTQIRQDKVFAHIPVIILTTSDVDKDIELAYSTGANAYITKPDREEKYKEILSALSQFWFHSAQLPPTLR